MVYLVNTLEHSIYYSIKEPKRTYKQYMARVNSYKKSKSFDSDKYYDILRKYVLSPVQSSNLWVDENGRICTKCNEYKPRSKIAYNKAVCKKCKNQRSKQYR